MSFAACCDCRKTDRVKSVASVPDQSPTVETVGVGIVLKPSFQSDTFLALVVHSLVPGSSADQSRMIQPGDILHSISDVDVYRRPANEVAKRLLGRPGTRVKLGLLRMVSDAPPAEPMDLKPFPESLVTSEGTYEHIFVELERKRIPQQAHVQWAAHPTRRQEHFQGQCFRRLEQTGARGQVLGQGRRIRLGAGSRWCGSTLARSRLKRGQDELFEAWLKSLGGGAEIFGRRSFERPQRAQVQEVAWAADGGGVGGGGAHDRLTPFTLSLHPV
eukprot:CAMPEP_0181289156 /NCGR_PEP_ID=MMETSP1101-20121128/731_1 /TAXON_ID=46948 /ORGANISM="Rhodomonas abbreviata, Strain Caron Lab Isolate" /LENGTH=272 /DNA_ID=CAMNT_0023393357 /DNA_START=230 /DNA_END=1050 /DNA_ORIENTATION=+